MNGSFWWLRLPAELPVSITMMLLVLVAVCAGSVNCKEEPHWVPVIQSPGKHGPLSSRDQNTERYRAGRDPQWPGKLKSNSISKWLVTLLSSVCPLPTDFKADEKSDARQMTWWDRGMMGSDCWMTSYGGHPALMSSKCEDLECVEWTSLNIDWISPFIWTGSGPSLNVPWMPQPSNITSAWSIFLNSICHVCVF